MLLSCEGCLAVFVFARLVASRLFAVRAGWRAALVGVGDVCARVARVSISNVTCSVSARLSSG